MAKRKSQPAVVEAPPSLPPMADEWESPSFMYDSSVKGRLPTTVYAVRADGQRPSTGRRVSQYMVYWTKDAAKSVADAQNKWAEKAGHVTTFQVLEGQVVWDR